MSNLYWYSPLGDYLAASPQKVFGQSEYWRLFTSSFIHGDMAHFLSNSVMLSLMGYFVAYHFKSIMFPVTSFIAGIFINLIVIWNFPPEVSLVGASGIVYYLWGFWLVNYICIQKHIPLARRFMKATAIGIIVLAPSEFRAQVSYYAHGVGLVLGVAVGVVYYLFNKTKIHSVEQWHYETKYVDDELVWEAMEASSTATIDHRENLH
jgi:rhomboid protease GluP